MGVKALKDNNAQHWSVEDLFYQMNFTEERVSKHFKVGFYKAISAFCVVFPK